jgi:hypothetical protein
MVMLSPSVGLGIDSREESFSMWDSWRIENEPPGARINLTVHKEVGSVRLDHKSFLIFETAS